MSGFVSQISSDELRARQAQAFSVGLFIAGTAANPLNIVLFNNMGGSKIIMLCRWSFSCSSGQQMTLFSLNADPGLAASNTPQNRLLGGAASGATFEAAIAASPATVGQLAQMFPAVGGSNEIVGNQCIIIPTGKGVLGQFGAFVVNTFHTIAWYELPA